VFTCSVDAGLWSSDSPGHAEFYLYVAVTLNGLHGVVSQMTEIFLFCSCLFSARGLRRFPLAPLPTHLKRYGCPRAFTRCSASSGANSVTTEQSSFIFSLLSSFCKQRVSVPLCYQHLWLDVMEGEWDGSGGGKQQNGCREVATGQSAVSRNKCFFPRPEIACFTFYVHLCPIYRLSLLKIR
jgi:hypothetical protein